jgi:hypothetical protein
MRLSTKKRKAVISLATLLTGTITFLLRPIAKALLYKVEELKLYLMQTFKITMEEDYFIREQIYAKNKNKNASQNNG